VISGRFLPLTCLALALALVPTIIHSYSGAVVVDGRSTAAIATLLDSYIGAPTGREETWGKRRFDSDDWIDRKYERGGRSVRLTVVRSYDAKAVYHHPELAIAYRDGSFSGVEVVRTAARPQVPLFVLQPLPGERSRALYALHYDNGFVDNPVAFQIRSAAELLFSPRKPMTLFFVTDPVSTDPEEEPLEKMPATRVLLASIDSFLEQPAPTSGR
jgi:hypothetical protein